MSLKLISFNLCPFVQRSVITLLEKGMEYDITYLTRDELMNPPQWFLDISPFGKVPVLRVGEISLFESAVINEYIDEISPPSLHPADPLIRAMNRAWIVFAGELLMSQYQYITAKDEEAFKQHQQEVNDKLAKLENVLSDGPFFNGQDFCLIDTSYAPFFMRMAILEDQHYFGFYENKPKIAQWAEACLAKDSVKKSVIPDLKEKYLEYIGMMDGYAAKAFAQSEVSV